ncbi:MAG: hypothetical protein HY526_03315 [Betaproteobacteria bacterium]|nr:hypothetical protein [Betaproteobacteria bacterium]
MRSASALSTTARGTGPELGGRKPMRRNVVAPGGYLRGGDVVTCGNERIGRLTNRVVAAWICANPRRKRR